MKALGTTVRESITRATSLGYMEYDKVRIIYESERLTVVLAKSHSSPGEAAEKILGYLYEQPKLF